MTIPIQGILCKCGCGDKIKITWRYKYDKPEYINGHNRRGSKISELHRQILINRKVSEETREKMSQSFKKRTRSKEHCRKISEGNKGKVISMETRGKIGLANIGKKAGEKHHNWQGGKSYEPYTYHFNEKLKEKIRKRDGRICSLCAKTEIENGKRLAVHHMDYVKENCSEDNLITLCISCNIKVNSNRVFWTGFFAGYLVSKIYRR